MVDIQANTYINDPNNVKKNVVDFEVDATVTKLQGPLNMKGFHDMRTIKLNSHELTELTIEDCPNLEEITILDNTTLKKTDFEKVVIDGGSGEGKENKITNLNLRSNGSGFDLLSLKNCKKLEEVELQDLGKVKKLKGSEDFAENVQKINIGGTSGIHITTTDKMQKLEDIKDFVKNGLGVDTNDPNWKDKAKTSAAGQVAGERDAAKQEAKDAKDKLATAETERDQLKQRLEDISKELGLGDNADQQKIIDEIKDLKGRPTTSCTHTDYDTIKSQRDSLEADNEDKKRKISELEGTNNENIITKRVLVDKTNANWEGWGIKLSNEQKQKIEDASSAEEVEAARNEIIKTEISKLKDKNSSSTYLNVGLGTLAIGSLLALGWVLMKKSDLPITEPKKEKEK